MSVDVAVDVVIERSRSDVASFAGDLSKAGQWYENVESAEWLTPPPIAAGSKAQLLVNGFGKTSSYTYEIVELVDDERLVMRTQSGPFPMETTYTWAPAEGGHTKMTVRTTFEPRGLAKMGSSMISAGLRKSSRKDLEALKRALESR